MRNVSNISSEEELLQLRNDGKISQAEYDGLLGAMKKPPALGAEIPTLRSSIQDSKHKQGKIAFYLMLAGIVLPIVSFFVCFGITGGGDGDVIFDVCFFLSVLIEIPAFVFGVISWPDVLGKATVAINSILTVVVILYRI